MQQQRYAVAADQIIASPQPSIPEARKGRDETMRVLCFGQNTWRRPAQTRNLTSNVAAPRPAGRPSAGLLGSRNPTVLSHLWICAELHTKLGHPVFQHTRSCQVICGSYLRQRVAAVVCQVNTHAKTPFERHVERHVGQSPVAMLKEWS